MNVKTTQTRKPLVDILFWAIALVLIAGGIAANMMFSSQPLALRLLAWLVLAIVVLVLLLQTHQGRVTKQFVNAAKTELRKVVWPSRQQTMQITLMVALMVVITAVVLWGLDSVLLWAVGWITGQRG